MRLDEIAIPQYPNAYFRFTDDADVWVLSGHQASNYSYGSSRLHQPVYKKVDAGSGDQLHWLHGGLFYVPTETSIGVMAQLTPPEEFSPFEKRYNYIDPKHATIKALVTAGKLELIDPSEKIGAQYKTSLR